MNRIGWWLADQLSQSLEPSERDAVRGDQAELGTSGTQAAREGPRPGCPPNVKGGAKVDQLVKG